MHVVAVAQALLETPEAQAADTAGIQLALAGAFAVYSFKENKRLSLGKYIPCPATSTSSAESYVWCGQACVQKNLCSRSPPLLSGL